MSAWFRLGLRDPAKNMVNSKNMPQQAVQGFLRQGENRGELFSIGNFVKKK